MACASTVIPIFETRYGAFPATLATDTLGDIITMRPKPRSLIAGITAREQRKAPRTLTSNTRSNRPGAKSATSARWMAPALLTRMSMRPNASSAASRMRSTCANWRTSHCTGSARRPSLRTSSAVSWMVPGSRGCASAVLAATTTSQPSRASASATARPTPREEPVTTATRLRRRMPGSYHACARARCGLGSRPSLEGPVALRTPLYDAHVKAGARMVEFAGFDMPVQYKGVLEEHAAVRSDVGIFDVSHMGEVTLEGPRALEAAQGLVTNDLSKCKDGQAQYSALCNEKGGVIDDIIVYRFSPGRLFVCVNASGREKDFEWMRDRAGRDVAVGQRSDDWAQIAVQGPNAPKLVDSLCEPRVLDLGYYHFREATVAGVGGCIVARTGYTGEDGFEVFVPPSGARKLWDTLVERGAVPCGLGARDSLRLEVAYRLYGNDMDEEHTPLEAGLGWIVKLDKKGGFVGSEALARQKQQGLQRRLVGFKLTGKGIARHGYQVGSAAW